MRYYILFLLVIFNFSCLDAKKSENATELAKAYCDCLNMQLRNAPDSSVDLDDCERGIFSKSRLLSIYADYDNYDNYKKVTLDSASSFAILFRDITDTLCYNKINFKKVKKHPHAF